MANNELSGPAVTSGLLKWIKSFDGKFPLTVRAVFIPETIGAIVYLSRHLESLREKVVAGFVVTCIGDDRAYSFIPTRSGNTITDRVARHVLASVTESYKKYSFLDRGSDERQYCSPGVDLPVCSIMRSKYCEYPEYHTSADNLDLVTPSGLFGGFDVLRRCLDLLAHNSAVSATVLCEPQLGKRGLYPTLSTKDTYWKTQMMMNILVYADGRSLLEICEAIGANCEEVLPLVNQLVSHKLLKLGPICTS